VRFPGVSPSLVLDRPSEFLLYLRRRRRRTEPTTSRRFRAIDELDLFMHFLSGGLYLEPDPDLVHSLNPGTAPPTAADYRRFEAQAEAIRVDVHTDPLDAWMDRADHDTGQSKPEFRSAPGVLAIVDFLEDGHKPGWLRFGADLLNIDSDGQKSLLMSLKRIVDRTRADNTHHSFSSGYAGAWGFPILFGYTKERGKPFDGAREDLETYMVAKKHPDEIGPRIGVAARRRRTSRGTVRE
jgi:hypothetical protein